METTIQAIFDNMDYADRAMRKIKSSTSLSAFQFSPIQQNHTPSSSIIAPIYPPSDADRAEQTHGNLLPLSHTDSSPPTGECLLTLTIPSTDSTRVAAKLRNTYGRNITIQN